MKLCLLFVVLAVGLTNAQDPDLDPIYLTDPTSCPPEVFSNSLDNQRCCELLNAKRSSFADCCGFPVVVVSRAQHDACVRQLRLAGLKYTRCNIDTCYYRALQVIDANVLVTDINEEALISSFWSSVNNATVWEGIIRQSMDTCTLINNQVLSPDIDTQSQEYIDFWSCPGTIPKKLYKIIDCVKNYSFASCPAGIFKDSLPGCVLAQQYDIDCILTGVVTV